MRLLWQLSCHAEMPQNAGRQAVRAVRVWDGVGVSEQLHWFETNGTFR